MGARTTIRESRMRRAKRPFQGSRPLTEGLAEPKPRVSSSEKLEQYLKGNKRLRYRLKSDRELIVEAGQYSTRTECFRKNAVLYNELNARKLLHDAFGKKRKPGIKSKYADLGDDELIREAGRFRIRSECFEEDSSLHRELKQRGLLDEAFGEKKGGRKYRKLGDDELISLGKAYPNRTECFSKNYRLYAELKRRDLLDKVLPKQESKYAGMTTAELLKEAGRYETRTECGQKSKALHKELRRKNLLEKAYGKKMTGRKIK